MDTVKLLSPVGNFECLIAAVSNGADAVYLGSTLFNARRMAGNFSAIELKKAVQYAHLHGVEVYLTLNTLIKNKEIGPFLHQVSQAAQLGIDAIILQDLTFAPLIKHHFPQLKVHASTQATIMNSASVEYWKKYVDVFVLARELSKEEVRAIFDQTKVHLELFVHGHLCISYSGQCLISSLIGKRSGNRGLCASSCRKQYNHGNTYLLSAKDLCMINTIPEIIASEVKTIKIEGRMKSPEYVATTTRYYREQIDAYYQKNNIPVTQKTIRDLKLVFNREFTLGYFNNEKIIVDSKTPSKRGIFLGIVKRGLLELQEDIRQFDGIGIINRGEKSGDFVKKITVNEKDVSIAKKGEKVRLFLPKFVNGAKVYLISPQEGEDLLKNKTKIPINLKLKIERGMLPVIEISLLEKKISLSLTVPASKPEKYPLTKEQLILEMHKYTSLIFELQEVEITTDNSFIPKSILTAFRQELDEKILDVVMPIKTEKKMIPLPLVPETSAVEKKIHVRVYSVEGALEAVRAGAETIYYDIFSPDVKKVQEIVSQGRKEFFLHTPMVLTDKDIDRVKEIVTKIKQQGVLVNNVGVLQLGLQCKIILGYQMNIFNDHQIAFYGYPCLASVELNASEVKEFKQKDKVVYYAHGKPIVMTFKEQFDTSSLTDQKGYTFRLRETATSTEMLYSKTISILQYTPQLVDSGITQIFLDVEQDVFRLVSVYKQLLNGERVNYNQFKEGMTKGNWVKGV